MITLNKQFKKTKLLSETNHSILYLAEELSDDTQEDRESIFVIKEEKDHERAKKVLEKELMVSQKIERNACRSIVVPVLFIINEDGHSTGLMQFRSNGLFISNAIGKLEQRYRAGNIPIDITVGIIKEILQSMIILHDGNAQSSYLHLDLQPANIFMENMSVSDDYHPGHAKFIDFSQACQVEFSNGDSLDELMWTPGYAAPEIMKGETYLYRRSTDIYSVGAILYRMITGETVRHLYDEDEQNSLRISLEKHNSSLIAELMFKIVSLALDEDSKYRYQKADEMLADMEKISEICKNEADKHYYEIIETSYEYGIDISNSLTYDDYSSSEYHRSVSLLDKYLKSDHIDSDKALYIYSVLRNMAENTSDKISDDDKARNTYCGIACYNHCGRAIEALSLFESLNENKVLMPTSEYLATCLRASVSYTDIGRIDKAYQLICKTADGLEKLKKLQVRMSGSKEQNVLSRDLGRAYSSKAVLAACIGDETTNSVELFRKALNEFEGDHGNRMITLGHLLQYAIHVGDRVLLEQYEKEYFGNEDTYHTYLVRIGKGVTEVDPYKMIVCLKAICEFEEFISDETDKAINYLLYQLANLMIMQHPAELIYKYIGKILFNKKGMNPDVEFAFKRSIDCLNIDRTGFSTFRLIALRTMFEYDGLIGEEHRKEIADTYSDYCKKEGVEYLLNNLSEVDNVPLNQMYEYN